MMCKTSAVFVGLLLWCLSPLALADSMECKRKSSAQTTGQTPIYQDKAKVKYAPDDVIEKIEINNAHWGCPLSIVQTKGTLRRSDNEHYVLSGPYTEGDQNYCGYVAMNHGHIDTDLSVGDMEYLCPLILIN